jgi:hypothetical protein
LSVQPHSALLHVTGVAGALVMRPVTSVSKTQPLASPPDELLDELPPEELPEELPDELLPEELPEELLGEPLDEASDDPLELPPASSVGLSLLLLLLPQPVPTTPAAPTVIVVARSARALRTWGLMCRYHSRLVSAS